ncbi:MAG: hypothetical protein Q3999_03180 [Buchananella hordeovulneris]|nr:hypothetical protein [Buchananella hordeovulneris]
MRKQHAPARIGRPRFTDPRLLVGILLLCASVAIGALVVGRATSKLQYYMVVSPIEVGATVGPDQVRAIPANLGEAGERYLTRLPQGMVARRSLAAGELLPTGALAAPQELDLRRVMVPLGGELPQTASIGAKAELWLLPEAGFGTGEKKPEPELVATDLVIARLPEETGGFGRANGGGSVELVVPSGQVPKVLAGVNAPGSLTLVPTGEGQ